MVIEYTATPINSNKTTVLKNPLTISYNRLTDNIQVVTNKKGICSIQIAAANGRSIKQIKGRRLQSGINTISLDTIKLPKGVLLLTVKNSTESVTVKTVHF